MDLIDLAISLTPRLIVQIILYINFYIHLQVIVTICFSLRNMNYFVNFEPFPKVLRQDLILDRLCMYTIIYSHTKGNTFKIWMVVLNIIKTKHHILRFLAHMIFLQGLTTSTELQELIQSGSYGAWREWLEEILETTGERKDFKPGSLEKK